MRTSYRDVFGADFETDNDGETAWVVQWSISDGRRERYGGDLAGWQSALHFLAMDRGDIIVYYHNLNYDMQFMRSWLADCEAQGWKLKLVVRKGSPIKLKLSFDDYSIEIRDSMKKIDSDLKSIGKLIGLPKQESGTDFYPGWSKKLKGEDDEWCYVRIDSRIVALAMRQYHKDGFNRATASGDAWQCAKRMVGSWDGKNHTDFGRWESMFPELTAPIDAFVRDAYFGGVNYSNNKGINGGSIRHYDIHNSYGSVMYWDPLPYGIPTITHDWPLEGPLYVADVRIKLKLREGLLPWFQFKNAADYLIEEWEYGTLVQETRFYHNMRLTSVDLCTLSAWYEIEVDEDYEPTFLIFKSEAGILRKYIDQYTEIKEQEDAEGRKGLLVYNRAKKMINMVYGRFGLSRSGDMTVVQWDDDLGDYDLDTIASDEEVTDSYIPFAAFATAYARARLLDNVKRCMETYGAESVIHCDTDSVIYTGEECEGIEYGDHLGSWGLEATPPIIIEAGFKRYMELARLPMESMDDLIGMACAGVPQKMDYHGNYPVGMWVELLDDPMRICEDGYILGNEHYRIESDWLRDLYREYGADPDDVNTLKLMPRKVPGGVILEGRQHKLNDNLQWRFRRRCA